MIVKFEPTKQEAWLLGATFAIGLMMGVAAGPIVMFGFIGSVFGGWAMWLGLTKLNRWRTQRFIDKLRCAVRSELGGAACSEWTNWKVSQNASQSEDVDESDFDNKYEHGE